MIRFKNIKIQSFCSFQKQQSFDLEREEGLYFIKGENKQEPELGANGAGKSTIFEALTWCLFEKTSQSLKAGDIKNWESKEKCRVELEFTIDTTEYLLVRTWNPNTLLLNDETIVQERVDNLLNITYDSFLHSVFISQLGDMFFDLKPAVQSEVMGNILNLDKWIKYSNKAATKTKEHELELTRIQQTIDNTEGKIESTEQLDYTEDLKEWKLNIKREALTLKMSIKAHHKKFEKFEKEEQELNTNLKKHTSKESRVLEKLEKDLEANETKLDTTNDKITDVIAKLHKLECKSESVDDQIEKIEAYGPSCSECGQEIPKVYKERVLKEKEIALDKIEDEIGQVEDEKKKLQKNFNIYEDVKAVLCKKIDTYNNEIAIMSNEITEIQKEKRYIDEDIETDEKRLKKVQERVNPFKQKESQRQQLLQDLKDSISKDEEQHNKILQKYEITKYWIKGFKEIRLSQIDKALYQFEIESNNALFFLGLGSWKIKFNIDRETKSGTISKGFVITILSPYNKKEVKWKSWSGGESQRLRIAGTMGLIEVIKQYSNFSSNIEAWDEPLKHLSEKGIEDVVEVLKDRSLQQGKAIFLVEHRLLERGQFNSIFTVIKDESGSHIVEE